MCLLSQSLKSPVWSQIKFSQSETQHNRNSHLNAFAMGTSVRKQTHFLREGTHSQRNKVALEEWPSDLALWLIGQLMSKKLLLFGFPYLLLPNTSSAVSIWQSKSDTLCKFCNLLDGTYRNHYQERADSFISEYQEPAWQLLIN